ncbi:alpha/beta hydrolase [Motiliproteus sediminis]|uniref:alpha/beta hydrolase n=1 Tax=Motiliproteus sediminis TaxID=1468178 RepID=UPI001AEF9EE4|nr:alpha/beta fold hydrolase [Motiliproteus sediminis]
MMNFVLGLLSLLLLAFLALVGVAYFYQDRMLFHPTPVAADSRDKLAPWAVSSMIGGARLHGWYAPADRADAPLLVYYGGNAEEVSWNLPALRELGVAVLLFNYRGYGLSEGEPSEAALKADALALLDHWLEQTGRSPAETILMGRSLGSGVATYVASQRAVRGVILVTPYDSLVRVGQTHYPWFPVSTLMRNRFESIKLAPQLSMPLLSILAEQDRVVPPALGRRLSSAWQGPVTELEIKGADHINLTSAPDYQPALKKFVDDLSRD